MLQNYNTLCRPDTFQDTRMQHQSLPARSFKGAKRLYIIETVFRTNPFGSGTCAMYAKKSSGAYSCTFMTVVLVAHHPPLCHIRMDKKWYRNALERSILSFFIYLPIYVYTHSLIDSSGPSLDQSIHLICVYLSIYLSIHLSDCLSIYLSIYLSLA